MENLNYMKGNCMTGCKHCIMKEIYEKREFKDKNGVTYAVMNEFVDYKHLCDGGHQKEYDEWHERNKNNTYEVYKNDPLPCYEPTNFAKATESMIETMDKILDKINKVPSSRIKND